MDLYAFGGFVVLVLVVGVMFARLSRPVASRDRGPVTRRPISEHADRAMPRPPGAQTRK